jgi:methylated-DNA-protein-cysteine methyltransferase-like protein
LWIYPTGVGTVQMHEPLHTPQSTRFLADYRKAPDYYGHTMVHDPTSMGMSAMSNSLYHRIYEVVRHIPQGRVATYGQVALVVGPPVTAQQVGEAMAALRDDHPDPPVPWQRVINAQGKVSTGRHQQQLLEQEGIVFNAKGSTDLRRFGWQGPDPAWAAAHGFSLLSPAAADEPQLDLF